MFNVFGFNVFKAVISMANIWLPRSHTQHTTLKVHTILNISVEEAQPNGQRPTPDAVPSRIKQYQ